MSGWVAGAVVVGGVVSSRAAAKGAETQAGATRDAAKLQNEQYYQTREDQMPWLQTGNAALNKLSNLVGVSVGDTPQSREMYRQQLLPQFTTKNAQLPVPSGTNGIYGDTLALAIRDANNKGISVDEAGLNAEIDRRMAAAGTSPDYGKYARDFGMSDFQEDPGYAFRLSEGQKALERSAAARGGLISGSALKAATRFGQDMGSQEYQNAYNRYQTNRSNQLNTLQSLAGVGQTAATNLGAAGQANANAVGGYMTSGAAAQAAGYMGQANALNQGVSTYINYNQGNNLVNALNANRYAPNIGQYTPGSNSFVGPMPQ